MPFLMCQARTTSRIALCAMRFIDRSTRYSGGDGKKKKGKSVVSVSLSVGPRAVSGGKRENKKERGLSLATRLPIDLPRWRCTGKGENKKKKAPHPVPSRSRSTRWRCTEREKENQKTELPYHLHLTGICPKLEGTDIFFFRIPSLHLVGINESVC